MQLKSPDKNGWIVAIVTGLIAIALPYVLPVEHHGGFWESVPAWWGAFGFVGCVAIILVSKWLGHVFLQKPEDWYDG